MVRLGGLQAGHPDLSRSKRLKAAATLAPMAGRTNVLGSWRLDPYRPNSNLTPWLAPFKLIRAEKPGLSGPVRESLSAKRWEWTLLAQTQSFLPKDSNTHGEFSTPLARISPSHLFRLDCIGIPGFH